MAVKILTISFYILFFFTPMFWLPYNFELFEYNKMMLVYFLTTIIVACWIWKMISEKSLAIKRTPLDIPILFFLGANILSTIFSIDSHISIWGYYSRSNGGLLSILSYTLLYFAFTANFSGEQAIKFLKAAVFGGVVVALYAIPEHFGISPSCIFITGQLNAGCWVQDVQSRVFATLGQPNWLAAYLAMLIFPCFYFALTATKKLPMILYTCYSILFYLAFTFTYSRGATLGFLAGFGIFLATVGWQTLRCNLKGCKLNQWRTIFVILTVFLLINLFFGFALTDFKLISRFAAPTRPALVSTVPAGTQLENGGTESGAIRLIVWQGALEILKHNPIFGTGVETFAFSYYKFRPAEHNLTSEWDFLYNKAHNEYLNYLANTGIVGFLTYCIIFITFIIIILRKPGKEKFLSYAILASYISYLVSNFFGFSVVIIAVFFYLFPAIAFLISDSTKPFLLPKKFYNLQTITYNLLFRRPFYTKLSKIIIIIIAALILVTILRYYSADTYFAVGNNANEAGNPGRAYNQLVQAVSRNPGEPYYRSELGYAAAASAVALAEDDPTTSARLKDEAIKETEQVLKESPKNVSFHRTAIRTYYYLSTLDKSFTEKTLQEIDNTIALAPTDAKLFYNKAVILGQTGRNQEAIQALEKTISLKLDYIYAHYTLGLFYFDEKQKEKAIEQMKKVLQLVPNDPNAEKKLKEWGK